MLFFRSGQFGLLPAAAEQDWLENERLDFSTSLQYAISLLSCFRPKMPVPQPAIRTSSRILSIDRRRRRRRMTDGGMMSAVALSFP